VLLNMQHVCVRLRTETPRDGVGIPDVTLTVVLGHCLANRAGGDGRALLSTYTAFFQHRRTVFTARYELKMHKIQVTFLLQFSTLCLVFSVTFNKRTNGQCLVPFRAVNVSD
jgi:hypothetical protein